VTHVAEPVENNASEPSQLFFDSARLAGGCLGGSAPAAISVDGAHRAAHLIGQEQPLETAGWDEAASLASVRLREQPVVLVAGIAALTADGTAGTDNPLRTLLELLEWPSDDALLGLLLPASLITSRRHQGFRETLVRRWQPTGVIYSTGALPEAHSSEQLVLLYLRPRSGQTREVHVFRVPRTGRGADVEQELTHLLAQPSGSTEHGYVLAQPWTAETTWRFDLSAAAPPPADSVESEANMEAERSARTFGDLFERVKTARKDAFPHLDRGAAGAVRLLRFRDFSAGTLVPAEANDAVWAAIHLDRQLQAGDIIMQSVLHDSATRGPAVAVIAPEDLPAALEGSMNFAFRLKQPVEDHHLRLLVAYLNSAVLQRYAVGGPIRRVQWKAIQDLPLPAPDEALVDALDELNEARRRTLAWHHEATALRQSSFTDRDREAARQRIISEGRVLRLRVEAASQLDDDSYIYRTTLPYPIALRWREVEAKVSITDDPGPAYQAVLATAEILFCYCALVAAALAYWEGVTIPRMSAIRSRLTSGGTAPGFGDWVAVLQELPSAVRRLGLQPNHPLTEFTSFGADQDVLAARVRICGQRNDESHERRADELDLPGALQTALADLRLLLKRALFLADLPLSHITSVRWDALREKASVDHHRLMGDHPIVPISTLEQDHPGLEVGSLYVIDSERRFHLLRPFLTRQLCKRCRAWSTFHLDRTRNQDVLFKSLEHGHPMPVKEPSMRAALQQVGLL
jgi:hypothetical protein